MQSPYLDFQQVKLFPSLDGIRFLSILAVVAFHSVTLVSPLPFLDTIQQRGFLGVDMFFVLSGFLIVTLMLREESRSGTISISQFYLRRILRIFPAYFLYLGTLLFLYLVVSPGSPERALLLAGLPFHLTFLSNWVAIEGMGSILWSLATEEQFYLVWPMVQKVFHHRWVMVFLAVVILISQLFNFRLVAAEYHDSLNILQSTFTPIALGALLANLVHRALGFQMVHRITGFPGASVLWLAVVLGLMGLPGSDISGWLRLSIQLSMALFLASCVVRKEHWLSGLLSWAPVKRIGQISYGIYLYHILVLSVCSVVMKKFGLEQTPLLFPATFVGSVLLAELSYRFWETPFLKLKDRLVSQKKRTVAETVPLGTKDE